MLLLAAFTGTGYAQWSNRPVPPGLRPYTFEKYSDQFHGYYYVSPFHLGDGIANNPGKNTPLLLDKNGFIAWYYPNNAMSMTDFKFFPDQQAYGWIKSQGGFASYQLLDTGFQLIDSVRNTPGVISDAHEWLILSNGHYIIGGERDSVMDLSGYTFNGNPGSITTLVQGYLVQEFDAAHNLVFEWNSNDHIHPTEAYENIYGYNATAFDYCHGNAICEDTDGHLLLSFRHLDAVYKINHTTGAIIWRLGGKSNDFSFTNDAGFSGQHDIRIHADGSVSLFDNGNHTPPPRKSRALHYVLDTVAWTATRTYEYIHSSPLSYSRAMGNHQATADGLHCIGYGLIFRPRPSVVLLDDQQQVVSKIYFADSVMTYRAYCFDMPAYLPRPEISCGPGLNGIQLFAPAGFSQYQWNTGETTSSITPADTGWYMVWVNHGVGRMGSFPFHVTDLSAICTSDLDANEDVNDPSPVVAIYDLLGRKLPAALPGQYYILLHENGSRELRYCTEKGFW